MIRHTRKQRQAGVALITALLVTALVAMAVVSLASRQFVDLRRTSNVMETDQAYLYALGIESVAKSLLSQYKSKRQDKYDKLDDEQLFQEYTFPVEGGGVKGNISDLEAKFNLNRLLDPPPKEGEPEPINAQAQAQLECILRDVMAEMGKNSGSAQELVHAIADWIDGDQYPRSQGGAEDSEYLGKERPYRAANTAMVSVSELLLIEGFDRELLYGKKVEEGDDIKGLVEYVTVLPTKDNKLNVNTAEPLLIQCISSKFTKQHISDLKGDRPYKTAADFDTKAKSFFTEQADKDAIANDLGGGYVTVDSRYYMVNATASVGRSSTHFHAMIYQRNDGSFGSIFRSIGSGNI